MQTHPFTHAYIGLGLLDEGSIQRHRESWAAEYRDAAGSPYLVVYVGPRQVRIEEFDAGKRVALTVDTTPLRAIGRHGQDALGGDMSRFWARVARTSSLVWIQLTPPDVVGAYVPAVGMGLVSVPLPVDGAWRQPDPGPLARLLGVRPFVDDGHVVPATMLRYVEGERQPREEHVVLHQAIVPGILLSEAIAAYYTANGPLRSIEWRPFVIPQPAERIGRVWEATIPVFTPDGVLQTGFAIIEDETAAFHGCWSDRLKGLGDWHLGRSHSSDKPEARPSA